MNTRRLTLAGATVALVTACTATQSAPVSSTTTTMARLLARPGTHMIASEHAVSAMAVSRCAREYTCENIGAGRAWPSYEDCIEAFREADRTVLLGCTGGIDQGALAQCLSDTRAEPCAPLVWVTGTCSSMDLCL
jgi:hypothetical protein